MNNVEIFCFRGLYYYGFGLTPEAALAAAAEAGYQPGFENRNVHKGIMQRLPSATISYGVNDFGALCWHLSEGANIDEQPVDFFYNPTDFKWGTLKSEISAPQIKGEPYRVKVNIEGFVLITAVEKSEAEDSVIGMSAYDLIRLMEDRESGEGFEVHAKYKQFGY